MGLEEPALDRSTAQRLVALADPRFRVGSFAAREALLAGPEEASLCHNDCYYGNVLVLPEGAGWRVSGLVDFENVLAGDPVLDLAKTHCYARRRSEETLAALAEGHGDLRADWREALDVYVLYHWLELWDWFAYLGDTAPLAALADDMRRLVGSGGSPAANRKTHDAARRRSREHPAS